MRDERRERGRERREEGMWGRRLGGVAGKKGEKGGGEE